VGGGERENHINTIKESFCGPLGEVVREMSGRENEKKGYDQKLYPKEGATRLRPAKGTY